MAVVERERRGRVEVLRLNRPEARNAINDEVSHAMEAALDDLEPDRDVAAVVITGTGPVFCAGADLKMVAAGRGAEIVTERGGFAGLVTREFPKPLIAAVQGTAVAGGFEITLACDVVVAADTAVFGLAEAKRGLLASAGGLIRLPKRVPRAIALEIAMTGEPITVARAFELGLVNRVVPADEVLDTAVALGEQIAANSPLAVRAARELVRAAHDLSEADGWKLTSRLAGEVGRHPDAIEGATAFAEKRPPNWTSY